MQIPSALSTSRAYSISAKFASISGMGKVAKLPKRPGKSATSLAAYSLHSRDSLRADTVSPNHTPGVVIEPTAVTTPSRSMFSTAFVGLHLSHSARNFPAFRACGPSPAKLCGGVDLSDGAAQLRVALRV